MLALRSDSGDVAAIEEFLEGMPPDYLSTHAEDEILDHWDLCQTLDSAPCGTRIAHFDARGFTEITVCARDRPGLFASVAGVLSAVGLSILNARLATSPKGWAIETFRVEHGAGERDARDAAVWSEVEAALAEVLSGRRSATDLVNAAIAVRASRVGGAKPVVRPEGRVEIDNDASSEFTVVDVYATDRPALLFLIADAIYRQGLNVHLAHIVTHLKVILDVFYVTDSDGRKIDEESRLQGLRATILDAISHPDSYAALAEPPAAP